MRLTAVLALACLITLAFAGCSDKDGDGDGTSSTSTSSSRSASSSSTSSSATATTTSSTSTSTGAANRPPTGSISAVVNGTAATFNLTGADPDGDALTWTLAFGDGNSTNGTTLPATVRHNYTAAGNRTVNFTVTDGKSPATYNVTVTVGSATSGPAQSVALSYSNGMFGCAAPFDVAFPGSGLPAAGTLYGEITVDAATIGKAFRMTMAWTSSPAGLGGDISFYGADDAFIDNTLVTGGSPLLFEGDVPAGAVYAIVSTCDPAADDVTAAYMAG